MSLLETDQELLTSFRAGEIGAFERLYERHARPVLTILTHILGDRDEAEDELQETFVSFAQSAPQLGLETNIRAYLVAAARNRALNRRRGRNRRHDFARRYEVVLQYRDIAAHEGVSSQAEADERLRRLNDGLNQLTENEREVVLLHTQAELTFKEIAELLKTPQGTVATRYRSALSRLRELLA
ncbi:MAG TPA: sigma-70 family RNA polymerase sigma factor [Planctomycetota bacterium]|nr:sigma-70 family RNA polymerase sigma factor [Planctomycetota bacterium]